MDSKSVVNSIQQWLHLNHKDMPTDSDNPPLPAELFTAEQMERYGIGLAMSHTLVAANVPDMLLNRLAQSETIISMACDELTKNATETFSPAGEWLLDNFYLIQEEICAIRRLLPKGYGRMLPQLIGRISGYPRVYDITREMIQHGDGHWDIDNLSRFIMAYQSITPLTLGELWAIPITLSVALIENISHTSRRVMADRKDRMLAAFWADRMVEVALREPKSLVVVIADMARSDPIMSNAFVAELAKRLQGAALSLPLSWIEQHIAEEGWTIEQKVQDENKSQAANQLAISNSIESLRRLSEVNWRDFVEAMSVVEKILRQDPADTYSNMDFGTRDRYRHVVEKLSRISKQSEEYVASSAIQLAKSQLNSLPVNHVGYYLIDDGFKDLEKVLGLYHSIWQRLCCFVSEKALPIYVASILLITGSLLWVLLTKTNAVILNRSWFWLMGIALLIALSQLGMAFVNLISTCLVKPQTLPRMDFSKGIPPSLRSLVVVPAMLSSSQCIESLIDALEVRFLGNRDPYLHFMLLTDFTDAPNQYMKEDTALLQLAEQRISDLNARYATKESDIFFLCHRPRQWNESENSWMGKERKRGKLTDLNALLRSNNQTNFIRIIGRADILASIKYVITLDSDTQLPRESARQYIATMAHPLNWPRLDAVLQRVVKGYGILQPRVAEAMPLTGLTRYMKLSGNEFGMDPYTRMVSNVYQDVFHEGSFIGKGIYDVDLFQQVLGQRFPDNHILSHDLLEGCYLRSGFLSDLPLYEQSPGSYLVDVKRRIRWIRGDWQIAGWLLPSILNKDEHRVKNPLSFLSKFKIADNLRRSLVPISQFILFGLSFTLLSDSSLWFGMILVIIAFPAFVHTLLGFSRKPGDVLIRQHIANIFSALYRSVLQFILYLSCLPYEVWYSASAILRTIWRVLISKHHLLEWMPYDQIDQHLQDTKKTWLITMCIGPVTAILVCILLIIHERMELLFFVTPLLLLWLVSPMMMYWLSRPFRRKETKLNALQLQFLHKMARKTWDFFDVFMTADNHWLPPDNYQQSPVEVLARRTSPTNMGLALLANLSAYDFGYINRQQLLERTSHTLQTMMQLERYRGHFYNWYDTEKLTPLLPRYVSTVDSGNLAGHLLTLRQGLLELAREPLFNHRLFKGLEDTLLVMESQPVKQNQASFTHFHSLLQAVKTALTDTQSALKASEDLCQAFEKITSRSEWEQKCLSQCYALRDEIRLFGSDEVKTHLTLINTLADQAYVLAQMDYSFLYDTASHLMTIGFNVDAKRCDTSRYDLLSSEARLGNYVAIAQGQVLQESWFALGRLLVSSGHEPTLISWSGSMFEYLMPLLVMPNYADSLLDQTYHSVVQRQIAYGKSRGLPWGVSESGYYAFDTNYNYLYRAFGVPGLGLKRGLEEDMVVAPYASVMALMVAPEAACQNLQRLTKERAVGKYGFYEAIDFTVSRLPRGKKRELVHSFMTHHQGMSLLAFSYLLHHQPMQKRFVADQQFQSALLLLQERIPRKTASYLRIPAMSTVSDSLHKPEASMRVFMTPNKRTPQVQLLSNGHYHSVLTQAGGGYSRWNDMVLTRWREDTTCDNWGLFCYLKDVRTGEYWSTSYQPTPQTVENFKAVFSESHVEFSRSDHKLDLHTEIVVSPEDDIELRRLRIHNRAKISRVIEFTSYAEIVLSSLASDLAQPAFNNLFIETEILPEDKAILANRRQQDATQSSPWLCHLLNVYSDEEVNISFETDRKFFVGRGRTLLAPLAMLTQGDLSNTHGAVLDPIIAIRCRMTLEPDDMVILDLLTGVSDTRSNCMKLIKKYQDRNLANRISGLAWTHGQVLLNHLSISEADAQLYGRLASAIIYPSNARRADASILKNNRLGQSSLWRYAISGDLPIILLHIEDVENIELIRHLIKAQTYWRLKGLFVDVFILNEELTSYRQSLQDQIKNLMTSNMASDHTGTIVVRNIEQVTPEDLVLLQSVARVILSDKRGTFKEQLSRRRIAPPVMPLLSVNQSLHKQILYTLPIPDDLQYFNGLGGYNRAGDEYIIHMADGVSTPMPWVNILANPYFGTLVSECGQGYTWVENAHEFRLTPWDNDPVKDSGGEAFYLRDEATGVFWSPTALPCRGRGDYQTRHGFGYSIFEHDEYGIHTEMCMTIAQDAPVKFVMIKIRNDSKRRRQLSVTGFVAFVLGDLRSSNAMYINTELTKSGAILANNYYNTDFGERTVFFDATTAYLNLTLRTVSGDRTEFIGRNGTLAEPAALKRKCLSGRVGAGLDPCGAIQLTFDLEQGETREVVFILGAGQTKQDANALLQRYSSLISAKTALNQTQQYWQRMLSVIHINTPDPAINLLANGWLLYQVLSSRLWGRTGYYQSSGAFGFRDQLQDVMSLAQVAPDLLRAHILLCAEHQFEEGDVQHWWHPPFNRGVRTRCSDDYLWLPFAICHYIDATGDESILNENIPFLKGRPLQSGEESYYELAMTGTVTDTLYQHAIRAIKHGLQFGQHGLPLIGSGDWNDAMNLVGKEGKGESVWLAFFLYSVLIRFIPHVLKRGDNDIAAEYQTVSQTLQQHIEAHGWDGAWYRRAYFDDGTPLGSASNTQCQIDSIVQSWSVLSGAADASRAKEAMQSLYHHLVSETDGLIKLLTPPFDHATPNPGYIEGYVPGIRENGGQYTHAAVWAAMAFAKLNEMELAHTLLTILNPIHHGSNAEAVERYEIEPYVLAGDVYSVAPHVGHGGWSWYTGSAGWLYRFIIEDFLGVQLEEGKQLRLTPRWVEAWDRFTLDYRYKNTVYEIMVNGVTSSSSILLDGVLLDGNVVPLLDDGKKHSITVNVCNKSKALL